MLKFAVIISPQTNGVAVNQWQNMSPSFVAPIGVGGVVFI